MHQADAAGLGSGDTRSENLTCVPGFSYGILTAPCLEVFAYEPDVLRQDALGMGEGLDPVATTVS
ncbi:hypothetical protein Kisp02_55850 [Kineosporia sp. NBRC 101731]|nr:hypothetical protein Kisp02_55850 [Kineosporia sp. NBRC 101731]